MENCYFCKMHFPPRQCIKHILTFIVAVWALFPESLTFLIISHYILLLSIVSLALKLLGVVLCSILTQWQSWLICVDSQQKPSWPIPSLQNSILISASLSNGSPRICPQRKEETYSFLLPPYSMPISFVWQSDSIWEQITILWDTEKELVCSSQGLTLGQVGITWLWRHIGLSFLTVPGLVWD